MPSEVIEIDEEMELTIDANNVEWKPGLYSGAIAGSVSAVLGTCVSIIFAPGFFFSTEDALTSLIVSGIVGGASGSLFGSVIACTFASDYMVSVPASVGVITVATSAAIVVNKVYNDVVLNLDADSTKRNLILVADIAVSAFGGGFINSAITTFASCCSTLFYRNKSPVQSQVPEMRQEYHP
jgi:hypothetical protein